MTDSGPLWNQSSTKAEHELGGHDNYSSTDVHNNNTEGTAGIPEITTEELQTAINKLKKGKSPDSNERNGETNLQRNYQEKLKIGRK